MNYSSHFLREGSDNKGHGSYTQLSSEDREKVL